MMSEVAVESASTATNRLKPWQFQPGNPGRKSGTKNRAALLEEALKKVEAGRAKTNLPCTCSLKYDLKPCKTLDQHFTQMAMLDPQILIAVQRKRIPDLQHQTGAAPPVAINFFYGHHAPKTQIVQPAPAHV